MLRLRRKMERYHTDYCYSCNINTFFWLKVPRVLCDIDIIIKYCIYLIF